MNYEKIKNKAFNNVNISSSNVFYNNYLFTHNYIDRSFFLKRKLFADNKYLQFNIYYQKKKKTINIEFKIMINF